MAIKKPQKKAPDISTSIARARTQLLLGYPFFGTLAMHLRIIVTDDSSIPWAATDGDNLYLNPHGMAPLPVDQWLGVMAHEVLHCAFRHPSRRENRIAEIWQYATDVVINNIIDAEGLKLPANTIHRPDYAGFSAEEVYARLLNNETSFSYVSYMTDLLPPGHGKPGDAQGSATSDEEWQIRVTQAAKVAKDAGKLSGALARFAQELIEPVIDWRHTLNEFCTPVALGEQSWSRPNRRFIANGIYLPSASPDRAQTIVVAIDTSGSIDNEELALFRGEMTGIQHQFRPEQVIVMYVDTKVCGYDEFGPDEDIVFNPRGGGGTNFDPPFDELRNRGITPDAFVYFTDGYGSTSIPNPGYPVLWLLTGTRKPDTEFGYNLHMKPKR